MDEAWKRDTDRSLSSITDSIARVNADVLAQRKGIDAGLGALPARIDKVDAESAALPYPVSGTNYVALPNLQTIAANTWTTVHNFVVASPSADKKNAQVFLTCTPLVRYDVTQTYVLSRVILNGTTFPIAPVFQTGFSVGGGTFSGTSTLSVTIQMLATNPAAITNTTGAGRENSARTFVMAVWS